MRKRLFTLLLITALIVVLNIPVAAVTYSEARQDESLREVYLEELLETYPPPAGVSARRIKYTRKDSETATMAVQYLPFMIDDDIEVVLQLQLIVYPQSFEEYEVEDDFISTLFHEYNHLRAVKRDNLLEEDDAYMNMVSIFELHSAQQKKNRFQLASFNVSDNQASNNQTAFSLELNYDLEWQDLYDFNNYDSDYIDKDRQELSLLIIRRLIRKHVLEMLALEEEIYLHQTKLNPSLKFSSSRFKVYSNHYFQLIKNLNSLGASKEIKDSLESIFYREWIYSQKTTTSSLDI